MCAPRLAAPAGSRLAAMCSAGPAATLKPMTWLSSAAGGPPQDKEPFMFRATGDPARRKLRPGPRCPPDWSTVPAPGSRVVVTGAAGGLGRALSSALAEVGAEVVGIDRPGTEACRGLRHKSRGRRPSAPTRAGTRLRSRAGPCADARISIWPCCAGALLPDTGASTNVMPGRSAASRYLVRRVAPALRRARPERPGRAHFLERLQIVIDNPNVGPKRQSGRWST
jgi:hypothetical protein